MWKEWIQMVQWKLRSRFELWALPLATALVDKGLTLFGQSPEYWDGDYLRVHEANPWMRPLLETHPANYLLGSLLYFLLWLIPVVLLPKRAAMVLSVWVTIAHAQGARTWMYNVFDVPYLLHNAFNLVVAILLVWVWARTEGPPSSVLRDPALHRKRRVRCSDPSG
jgi:hypothetical protein